MGSDTIFSCHAAAGNLTDDGQRTCVWDVEQRLIRIGYTGTTRSTEFRYDGLGRRIAVREYSGTPNYTETRYLWCGERICQARNGSDTVVRRYYDEGEQLVTGTGATFYYYAQDHLGSVRDLVNASGMVLASYDYDPYGTPTRATSTNGIRADYRYAGLFYHAASGLYLTHYRVYDPVTARWLSRDPIGEISGVNLYGYVDGNPVSFTDPLGLYPGESAVNYVGGAVGGVGDFFRNYGDMRDADTIGGDKYFHCKANCESTKRGDGGRDAASCISDTREWADQHWPKNDPASASAADQVANRHGRDGANNNPGQSCEQICSPFRPRGLPSRY